MKILITRDNTPDVKSGGMIKNEFKRRRLKVMRFCTKYGFPDLYVQFNSWLKGQPNQSHYRKFLKSLEEERIVSSVESAILPEKDKGASQT